MVSGDCHERLSLGELIYIEHDFFRRVHAGFTPAPDRILLACLGTRVIEIVAVLVRYIYIGLLDATEQLVIELLLQRFGRLHDSLGIGVLGIEVSFDFRVFLVAQPEVVVDELVTVDLGHFWNLLGDGWRTDDRRDVGRFEGKRRMSHIQDYKKRTQAEDKLQHFFMLQV